MLAVLKPTPIYRVMHVDNLHTYLQRGGLHAPNHTPDNGLTYKTIHNVDVQNRRQVTRIPCGPGGVIHDYVSFYLGPRSPMLYQLHTGWVEEYDEGQEPIVYLISTAQAVHETGSGLVFSDGHGIAGFTTWFDNLERLDQLDWDAIYAQYWKDDVDDMDRQRRKQAEFLVHRFCSWELIQEVATINARMKKNVETIMSRFPPQLNRTVRVRPEWYYVD